MDQTYPIKIQKDKITTIYLPPSFGVSIGTIKNISFGTFSTPCTAKIHPEKKDEILLSEDLFKELKIPVEKKIHLFRHDETIHLGPLIGIFTAGFIDSPLRPIGDRSLFFAKLLSLEEIVGASAFVFGAHQIDWENGTINGLFYHQNGWTHCETPFPDVVYDRLPNRKIENHDTFKKIKKQLKDEYLIPWFNPNFFDKWEIHQLLQTETVKKYLPETFAAPTFELIEKMLKKHQNTYLKPMNGSLGHGVYQVMYSIEENHYYIRYQNQQGGNRLHKFLSFGKVKRFLQSKIDFKHYLIQQGISLQRMNGQKVDFRIHTNKDRNGIWQTTAMAGKIAGKGSVTTHVHNGGIVRTMAEIYSNPHERQEAIKRLTEAAIMISQVIDQKIDGLIGEIGFDFGIDHDHNIWLFEANSRPGRTIFEHPNLKSDDILSRELSMAYAIYLTEKVYHDPEEIYH